MTKKPKNDLAPWDSSGKMISNGISYAYHCPQEGDLSLVIVTALQ